ncbi:MAG: hypothetical protein ACOX5J_03955 [Candidatus Hydrogenedentales bacterium]
MGTVFRCALDRFKGTIDGHGAVVYDRGRKHFSQTGAGRRRIQRDAKFFRGQVYGVFRPEGALLFDVVPAEFLPDGIQRGLDGFVRRTGGLMHCVDAETAGARPFPHREKKRAPEDQR